MEDQQINILFLGASRLVGLLERFSAAGKAEGVLLGLYSLEDESPWHAVGAAGLASIIPGPQFLSQEFPGFLKSLVLKQGMNIIIPSIDSATVALSQLRSELAQIGVHAIVSDEGLCRAMYDKRLADRWFRERELPVPVGSDDTWPQIAKPRFGSSSRDITVLNDGRDLEFWDEKHSIDDHVVQRFVRGVEYSIDAFASSTGVVLGTVSRRRVVTSGGEAMVTVTEYNERVLRAVTSALSHPGWRGPLVFQAIDDGANAWLIECNPRFGSGATCSIEAGLDMPRWILREYLRRPLPTAPVEWRSGLCMTRSRKDWFLWLSS